MHTLLTRIFPGLILFRPDDGGGNGGGGDGDGGDAGGAGDGGGSSAQGSQTGGGGQAGAGGENAGGTGDDWTPPDRSSWDNVQRQLRETRQELKKFQADAEKQRRDQGQFEDLYTEEKRKREELEARMERADRDQLATGIAERLKFRRPGRAIRLLDPEAFESENSLERALKALAEDMPELVGTGETGRRQGAATGDAGTGGASMNDLIRQSAGRA